MGFRSAALLAAVLCLCGTGARADDVADFYKGKTITIYIGSSAGGGYDAYARLVGRHIGRFIPGEPNVLPTNMPGAGQTRAAFQVYSVAPKDGTAIAAVSPGALLVPLLGGPKIQYDPAKFRYIGSANSDVYTCIARPDAPVKAFNETFTTELIVGVSSGTTRDMPTALNAVLGTKLKLVTGYPGTKEITLAFLRGEVQGICGFGYASLMSQYPDWVPKGVAKVILQESLTGHPDLNKQNIPKGIDLARNEEERQTLHLIYSQGIFGRPFVVAPEVPAARVEALRKAFAAAMADKQLIADAQKMNLDLDPLSGAETQKLVEQAYATPAHVVARAKKALDIQDSGN